MSENLCRRFAGRALLATAGLLSTLLTVGGAARAASPSEPHPAARSSSAMATATVSSPGLMPASAARPKTATVSCEQTLTSNVAGVGFKTQAARVTDSDTVAALVQPLRQLTDAQGAALGSVEVLGWGAGGINKTLTDTQAQAVISEMKSALETAGFRYTAPPAATRSDSGASVTLMTAMHRTDGRRMIGFWIRTGNALLLAWGQVEVPSAGQPTTGHGVKSYNPQMTLRIARMRYAVA